MVEPKKGITLADVSDKLEFAEDNMVLNEEFKKNVAIPYFKDIYKDLVSQSDSKSKGINRITLLNVSKGRTHISAVLAAARHHRGTTLRRPRPQRPGVRGPAGVRAWFF